MEKLHNFIKNRKSEDSIKLKLLQTFNENKQTAIYSKIIDLN